MSAAWLFFAAYTCSGFAGLVYEVAWTRLLTLYMGHSTAAVSTVVAAFMGGLAAGAALGGRVAARLTRRQALVGYALLELFVVFAALAMPVALRSVGPALGWAYRDGAPGLLFPVTRIIVCFSVLVVPTMALGATFPFGARWLAEGLAGGGRTGGALYAANTAGAAVGALSSAFLLIPSFGLRGATLVGVAAGWLALALVLMAARTEPDQTASGERAPSKAAHRPPSRSADRPGTHDPAPRWLGLSVLALTGAATFLLEIAWTRVFASVIGPSTYAFAATLAGVIGGLAVGSMIGVSLAGRVARPAFALAVALGGTAIAATWVSSFAGRGFPLLVLEGFARNAEPFGTLLMWHALAVAALVAPAALGLGVAFPLALSIAVPGSEAVARRLGTAYAVSTLASVTGSLGAGFLAIPFLGLHGTLRLASALCLAAGVIAAAAGRLPRFSRVAALLPAAAAAGLALTAAPWDRELLASGSYKYASRLPKDVDLPSLLKAGRLLLYREGPTGIVSVKQLAGVRSLAIDGKVDASSAGDMLTQKVLAHLPLLLHEDPDTVCIIGLGSGVTLAAALVHPVSAVDVVEISPEVVDASSFFTAENRDALKNPRTRLILGDGRSHLAWSSRQYDVIISEPSNPWMAGVAALFTREFFTAARDRLAPGGIICQWAHTYDISDGDLRSIVETFRSVFPNGTLWLLGDGDLLLVGSVTPIESRLSNVQTGWRRAGVAEDLRGVSLADPFGLWSLFAGGPEELKAFGAGAPHQTDDRMALEFSGPSAINSASSGNTTALRRLLDGRERPAVIARSIAAAGAAQWRDRAKMMLGVGSYGESYDNYVEALTRAPTDLAAHEGIVRAAVASRREPEALAFLRKVAADQSRAAEPRVSLSTLLAAGGAPEEALREAREAMAVEPASAAAFDQLASLFADAGDANGLDLAVEKLRALFPRRATTAYYAAAAQFLRGRLPDALTLIRESIAIDPTRAASHNLLGAIHANLEQREEARAAFEAALRLDARDVTAYTNLALLQLTSGSHEAAADLFAEALTLDPTSAAARQGLAQAIGVGSR